MGLTQARGQHVQGTGPWRGLITARDEGDVGQPRSRMCIFQGLPVGADGIKQLGLPALLLEEHAKPGGLPAALHSLGICSVFSHFQNRENRQASALSGNKLRSGCVFIAGMRCAQMLHDQGDIPDQLLPTIRIIRSGKGSGGLSWCYHA